MLGAKYSQIRQTQLMAGSAELVQIDKADKLISLANTVQEEGFNDQIKNNKDDIIKVLGGMDNILSVFINNDHLSDSQINQLLDTLSPADADETTAFPISSPTSTSAISLKMGTFEQDMDVAVIPDAGNLEFQFTENVKVQQKKFRIYLNEEHTFWQRILPTAELSERITKFILFSRWSYAAIIFVFLLAMICRSFLPYLQMIPAIFGSFGFVCFLLTFNVSMTKRMMRSFVFWYKMYNWITFVFCYHLLFLSSSIIYLEAVNWVAGTLIIASVSLHDGCRWRKWMKTWTGMLLWIMLIAAYLFIYFEGLPEYFGNHYKFRDERTVIFGEPVSVKSNCLSAMFNLILFIGKQVFSTIKYGNKAAVLNIKPRVVWCKNAVDLKQKILDND